MLRCFRTDMKISQTTKSLVTLSLCFVLLLAPISGYNDHSDNNLEEISEEYYTLASMNMPGFQSGSIYSYDTISMYQTGCAVLANGEIECWGDNFFGQAGVITTPGQGLSTNNLNFPTNVNSLQNSMGHFVEVAAGQFSTCALNSIGEVYCWGTELVGQLGNGIEPTTDYTNFSIHSPSLVQLPENTSAVSISASTGNNHRCAILNNSDTVCWGSNNWGQLGDGTACYVSGGEGYELPGYNTGICSDSPGDGDDSGKFTPVIVQFPDNKSAISISTGNQFTCAVMTDNSLYCWGKNDLLQLGQGNSNTVNGIPTLVSLPGDRTVASVAAGGDSTCALSMDHNVYCWGAGGSGQLGDGSNDSNSVPGLVTLEEGEIPISITAGNTFYCILLDTGAAKCWGSNWHGGLGDGGALDMGGNAIDKQLPTNVSGNHSFIGIEAGLQNTCAIKANGSAYCWGRPFDGALGNGMMGTTVQINYPVRVGQTTNWLTTYASEQDPDGDGILTIFDSNPYPCNSGYQQIDNICVEVSPGSYSINGVVNVCDYGTYQPLAGQSYCLFASPGNYVNNTNSAEQMPCVAGTYQNDSGQISCIENSPGYYTDTESSENQEKCPTGTYQPNSGSQDCIITDAGYFTNNRKSVSQTPCPAGTYQPLTGQNTCLSADLGYYVNSSASISQELCDVGTFSDSLGQIECTNASPGNFVIYAGQSVETPCPASSYQPEGGQTYCILASAGHYVDSEGAGTQTPCQEGYFQPTEGAMSCIAASPGSVVLEQGATEESLCLAGTYSSEEGQDECTSAAPGSFVSTDGATTPTECPSGEFQGAEGSLTCTEVPAGYFTDSEGSSEPSPCQPGTYAAEGQTSCVEADPGFFVPDAAQSSMQMCDQGTFQPESGASSCIKSSPGNFVSKYAQPEQTPCEAGTFQPSQENTECIPAYAGQFVPEAGSMSQSPCQRGEYQPNGGQSECLGADPGNFVASSGATSQFPCSMGKYQPDSGQSSCEKADPGNFVPEPGASEQTPCDSGDTQPDAGQMSCIPGDNSISPIITILAIPILIIGSVLTYKYRRKRNITKSVTKKPKRWDERTIDYVPRARKRK
jgi:alpha-tubulin suppressor-like RCC1 family protein